MKTTFLKANGQENLVDDFSTRFSTITQERDDLQVWELSLKFSFSILRRMVYSLTEYDAYTTLTVLHKVEAHFGRVRSIQNAARVLDLDLLDFGGEVHHKSNISLPHCRMHRRAFVLLPLQDLVVDWVHPETGIPLKTLIEQLPPGQSIQRVL